MELRNALSSQFGVELPATVTFDHPTAAAIAALLLTMRGATSDVALAPDVSIDGSSIASWDSLSGVSASEWSGQHPVAIAAISAMLPTTLACGDAPRSVPLERWDAEQYVSAGSKDAARLETRFGAFVLGAELFDASAFNVSRCFAPPNFVCKHDFQALMSSNRCDVMRTSIAERTRKASEAPCHASFLAASVSFRTTKRWLQLAVGMLARDKAHTCDVWTKYDAIAHRPEAIYMDAQQRLLLEHAAEALAGLSHTESATAATAVMVGIGTVDYTTVAAHLGNSLYAASGAITQSPLLCPQCLSCGPPWCVRF